MDFTSQILFFFGALGVFNCLLLSFYFLFFKTSKGLANILFGFFLLFLSLRVLKSLFYFFASKEPVPLLQTGPALFIFIGPILYFYISTAVRKENIGFKKWSYHTLVWVLIAAGIYFVYPFKENIVFNKSVILPLINIQWFCYILASGHRIRTYFKKIFDKKQTPSHLDNWLILLLLATLLLWGVYFFTSYNYFIAGSLVFSVLFYCFFLFFIFNKNMAVTIFWNGKKHAATPPEHQEMVNTLIAKLDTVMTERKLFTNPTLKSSDVAVALGITVHQFSQLLNDNLGKNFSVFINEYRVEEAKGLLFKNKKYTLEAVGNQAGFNSKTTFFTTFKKMVGTTPSKYQSQF